jgi:hypothetical protein
LGFLRQNLHSVQYQKFVKVVPVSWAGSNTEKPDPNTN